MLYMIVKRKINRNYYKLLQHPFHVEHYFISRFDTPSKIVTIKVVEFTICEKNVFAMSAQGILAFIGVVICCLNAAVSESEQNYNIIFDKLTKEKEGTNIVETNFNIVEGDTIKINGELKQLVNLDDNWMVSVSIFRADAVDAEYAPLMALAPKGVCEMLKSHYRLYFYESLKEKVVNAPEPTECPLAQRTYLLKDYELDTSKYKKLLKPGYYRVVCIVTKDDDTVLHYIFDGHVVEDN